jgi:hypothetical protein
MKSKSEILMDKIEKGLKLSFKKLVSDKQKNDEEFVFSDKDRKIYFVKAREMKL